MKLGKGKNSQLDVPQTNDTIRDDVITSNYRAWLLNQEYNSHRSTCSMANVDL